MSGNKERKKVKKKNKERKKLVGSSSDDGEQKWLKYYSSHHQILLVGEGDFSFSLCLAQSFGSAVNIVASSLDTHDQVVRKHKKAMSNLVALTKLGASVLHGVDATQMKLHPDLFASRFDRIIFNFPHAGFHGNEASSSMIQKHKNLVRGFFMNARSMLKPDGEIHINHKIKPPFDDWCIGELGIQNLLWPIECVEFKKEDYPGYNNKRGDGPKCDEPFPLGKCSTFKFALLTEKEPNHRNQRILSNHHYPLRSPFRPQSSPSLTSCRHGHLPIFGEGGGGYLNSEAGGFGYAQSQIVSDQELETIIKQIPQQFGSETQGSQQQQSQTGSSTLSGPSTQNKPKHESSTPTGSSIQLTQPKPSATKKTLAAYAQGYLQKQIPQETWQQGVKQKGQLALPPVPLNVIAKQEYDIANQLPLVTTAVKPTQITAASSSKAVVIQNQQNVDTPYFLKESSVRNLLQVEPEFFHQDPNQVALKVFPSGFHFWTTNFRKTREYYELILVHSQSIEIYRKLDKKDETLITQSTLQISKVLTPSQWGQDLNKMKFFGISCDPEGYNYWDYVDAWTNVFWDQNKLFNHTWFIYFKQKTKYEFPHWFAHWWSLFGPAPEILPPKVFQALELFKQKFNISDDPFPIDLHYFSKFSVAWIFSWKYRLSSNQGSKLLPALQIIAFVRWWDKFNLSRIDSTAVEKWFIENPQHLKIMKKKKKKKEKKTL